MSGSYVLAIASVLIVSYLIGSVPFGFLIGKLRGIDIRKHGSGNIGATNVTRVVGPIYGKLCFFLDFLKGVLPSGLVLFLTEHVHAFEDPYRLLPALATFAVVAGHIWPIYLKFKGGKGISTAAGAILPLSPWAVLIGFAAWVVVFKASGYVSLASITAAVVLPASAVLLRLFLLSNASIAAITLFILLGILAILKHTSNIKRLVNGTENRFSSGDGK